MRRAICFLMALVFCFSLACTVSATINSPGQGGTPSVGGGNVWYTGSNTGHVVDVPADGNVEEVKVGNDALDDGDYTVTQNGDGTVKIIIGSEYLSKLPIGTYVVSVVINGQSYTFTLVVAEAGAFWFNPKTGDMARMELWVPMMIASALALVAAVFVYFKKFRKVN